MLNTAPHRDPECPLEDRPGGGYFTNPLWKNKTRFAVSPKTSAHAVGFCSRTDLGYSARRYRAIPHPHPLVPLRHRHSAPIGGEAALPSGFLCPLTSAPFGHDHQRRRAEQRRLAPGDPTPAPPGRRRHPAGDRPDSVDHATDR